MIFARRRIVARNAGKFRPTMPVILSTSDGFETVVLIREDGEGLDRLWCLCRTASFTRILQALALRAHLAWPVLGWMSRLQSTTESPRSAASAKESRAQARPQPSFYENPLQVNHIFSSLGERGFRGGGLGAEPPTSSLILHLAPTLAVRRSDQSSIRALPINRDAHGGRPMRRACPPIDPCRLPYLHASVEEKTSTNPRTVRAHRREPTANLLNLPSRRRLNPGWLFHRYRVPFGGLMFHCVMKISQPAIAHGADNHARGLTAFFQAGGQPTPTLDGAHQSMRRLDNCHSQKLVAAVDEPGIGGLVSTGSVAGTHPAVARQLFGRLEAIEATDIRP